MAMLAGERVGFGEIKQWNIDNKALLL